ncbi:MAG: VTT domain-containing protein, partial [Spirochaetes bacterium]|nr:VTT domain-containing protein [Spirochaetota bacterium]
GYYVVALNRFFPGIRSVISLVCGISRLSAVRVFLLCSLSSLIWNFIWIYVGYSLGSNWQIVKARFEFIIRSYNMAAGILIILIVAALIIRYFYKKRK